MTERWTAGGRRRPQVNLLGRAHACSGEWSFVLSGEIGVEIGSTTGVARPGDVVLKPRGVPYAFWNAGDEPARSLEVITPAGFEGYFAALAEVFPSTGRRTWAASPRSPGGWIWTSTRVRCRGSRRPTGW